MKYSTEPKLRKYVKGYFFYHLHKNLVTNMLKNSVDTAAKTGRDAAKLLQKE